VLALDRPDRESMLWERPTRLSRTHGQRFALGGVAFELLASMPSTTTFTLDPDAARYCFSSTSYPVIADVLCSVAVDDALFENDSPFGGLELADGAFAGLAHGELVLRGPRVRATLCRIAPQRYACSARIASNAAALNALLRSIIAVIVQIEGGVTLHAAAVALNERAVIYVGPSGAGKSTAASLTNGGRMFARDHVALMPQPDGSVLAYGLPGGKPAPMMETEQVVWPVAGLFRIMRDAQPREPRACLVSGAEALFTVREAIESADCSATAESMRLTAASAITSAVQVGTLHTVLGAPIGQLLSDRLQLAREARA
jgi:hypothetical protein